MIVVACGLAIFATGAAGPKDKTDVPFRLGGLRIGESRDTPTSMQRFQRQRFQDQQVQRATQKIGSFLIHLDLLSEYDTSTSPAIPIYSEMHLIPELTAVVLPVPQSL